MLFFRRTELDYQGVQEAAPSLHLAYERYRIGVLQWADVVALVIL